MEKVSQIHQISNEKKFPNHQKSVLKIIDQGKVDTSITKWYPITEHFQNFRCFETKFNVIHVVGSAN